MRRVEAEVILVLDSSGPRSEVTAYVPPTVDMITVCFTVRGIDSAVVASISSDVDKLVQNATILTRHIKEIGIGKWRANIISVVHAIGREVTSGSPLSGNISHGLHTGHWQAVVVPLRCVFVDWQVVQIERFSRKRGIIFQWVGLDQSPRETRLRTKVTVDWEWIVVLVHNAVDSIACCFVKRRDFFTWSRR